jgi:hypothetical protein
VFSSFAERLETELTAACERNGNLSVQLAAMTAERDGWQRQCDDRVADCLRIGEQLTAALDAVKRRDAEVNLLYDKLALGCCPPYPREVCSNQESCEVCWRKWIKTKLEG